MISNFRHLLLLHEPFLQPLLKLLSSCQGEIFSKITENSLVLLLKEICILLMQNIDLVNLFFIKDQPKPK